MLPHLMVLFLGWSAPKHFNFPSLRRFIMFAPPEKPDAGPVEEMIVVCSGMKTSQEGRNVVV